MRDTLHEIRYTIFEIRYTPFFPFDFHFISRYFIFTKDNAPGSENSLAKKRCLAHCTAGGCLAVAGMATLYDIRNTPPFGRTAADRDGV